MRYRWAMISFGLLTVLWALGYIFAPEAMWTSQGLGALEPAGRIATRNLGAVDLGVGVFALSLSSLEAGALRSRLLYIFSGTTLLLSAVLAHGLMVEGPSPLFGVGVVVALVYGLAFFFLARGRSAEAPAVAPEGAQREGRSEGGEEGREEASWGARSRAAR